MKLFDDIARAAEVLKGRVIRTPLVYSSTFSRLSGARVFLKLENLQETGSFKLRGATWKIHLHSNEIGESGVVAASAGNHAQGVALAAKRAGLKSTIVMPEWASISKQEATRSYGGEVVLEGRSLADSLKRAMDCVKEGKTLIHPYDDPDIIAGQGTIGLEILEELRDPYAVFVPIGGGGLIGGIACALKELRPDTLVVGVEARACPSAFEAKKSGKIRAVEAQRSIADGISVKQVGERTFPIIRDKVDEIVLVDEEAIASAMLMLLDRKKVLAEGAGAASLAGLLSGAVPIPKGSDVVLVISGGNVDLPLLDRVIRKGLFRNGRMMRFSVRLEDEPGALARLLSVIAEMQANVMHIYHNRSGRNLPIDMSIVELEVETRSPGHIDEISSRLAADGYRIQSDPDDLVP